MSSYIRRMAESQKPEAPNAVPERAAQAERPQRPVLPSRSCTKHNVQAAPDGKCIVCRREEVAPEPDPDEIHLGSVIKSNLAIVACGLCAYFLIVHEPPPPPDQGPPLAAQIEAVDAQLVELRRARAAGELSAQGLMVLSRLEAKRSLLVGIRDAHVRH